MRRDQLAAAPRLLGNLVKVVFFCICMGLALAPATAADKTEYVLDVPLPKRSEPIDIPAHKYAAPESFEETVGYYRNKFGAKDYVWMTPVAWGGTLLQTVANPYPTSKWEYITIVKLKGKVQIHILERAAKSK
jgi:hypothetical protein